MLQTRTGKRTAQAALKIAVDMVEEGLIDRDEAVCRIDPLARPAAASDARPDAEREGDRTGLPASPGAASGKVVFNADEAERRPRARRGGDPGARRDLPEDIHGMHAAKGILTARGGMTSHAAVVARGMGKAVRRGAGDLRDRLRRRALHGRRAHGRRRAT